MKQTVAPKPLSALAGIGLILGLVAVLIVLNYLIINLFAATLGPFAATLAFWILGGALALLLLRVFVVKYSYELGADVLRLTRSYGKRERFIEDIYINRILFVGSPEEAKKRCPNAAPVRALRPSDKRPVIAVAYRDSKGERIALIQADEKLKAAIEEARRKR